MSDRFELPEERDLPASRLHARREHLLSEIRKESQGQPFFRKPLVWRVAAGIAVVAVVLAVLSVVDVFGPNGPSLIEKAQAAVTVQENVVVHLKTTGFQDNGDGTTAEWSDETWQLSSALQVCRRVEIVSGAPTLETAQTAGGWSQVYDAETNTIYQVQGGVVTPDGPETFRAMVTDLLDSGGTKADEHLTFQGLDAVRIVSADGSQTYIVDAKTGEPLQWQTRGTNGSVTMRITYEKLPATDANAVLVDLAKQHPGAAIDSDQQHYQDALGKLAPKG
jgi:hypothetical protein